MARGQSEPDRRVASRELEQQDSEASLRDCPSDSRCRLYAGTDRFGLPAREATVRDRAIVVDSHDETTQRLIFDKAFDIAKRNPNGDLDIPRMREEAWTRCSSRSGCRARSPGRWL